MIKTGDTLYYQLLNKKYKAKVVGTREVDGELLIALQDVKTKHVMYFSESYVKEVNEL